MKSKDKNATPAEQNINAPAIPGEPYNGKPTIAESTFFDAQNNIICVYGFKWTHLSSKSPHQIVSFVNSIFKKGFGIWLLRSHTTNTMAIVWKEGTTYFASILLSEEEIAKKKATLPKALNLAFPFKPLQQKNLYHQSLYKLVATVYAEINILNLKNQRYFKPAEIRAFALCTSISIAVAFIFGL